MPPALLHLATSGWPLKARTPAQIVAVSQASHPMNMSPPKPRSCDRINAATAAVSAVSWRLSARDASHQSAEPGRVDALLLIDARHLVLLAFGASKADAVAGAVEGPVSANNPGSAIQMHPHVTVIVDEAAATGLAHADYYRLAWANQPEWLEL